MATIQELVNQVAILDTSVQAHTAQAAVTKSSADTLVASFQTTKSTVDNNLNNVTNTADADKIISDDVIAEFLLHVKAANLATVNGQPLNTGLELLIASSPTSLTSTLYNNRASLRTPANPQPIQGDALVLQFLGLFMFYTTLDEPDDDETCFTALDVDSGAPYGQWLLRVPAYEWTEAHEKIEFTALEEWRDDITESTDLLIADYSIHHV
tara:strand:- start:3554 stop:4186 length:633 start_codon:yes stop_codon:yes gene_type:complete